MYMKVGNINHIAYKGAQTVTKPEIKPVDKPQIQELQNVTPDFGVKIPQKYTKTGEIKLVNGLTVHSYKLANGHTVSIVPMENSPAIVKNYVNVGSMNETENIKGISHFLEHMAFNGTTGKNGYEKLSVGDSFKRIEKLGGWTNASTSLTTTDYINSTPLLDDKDLEEQIKIIAAMTEDLALTDAMIEKEKGPVCSEIDMILDSPSTVLMDQVGRTLFNISSSADELIAGSVNHIRNLTKEDVKSYYDKYYTPDNMNLVITGDVDPQKTIELVAKNFKSNKTRKGEVYETPLKPIEKTIRKDFVSELATTTNAVLAFAGPQVSDTKATIIGEILARYFASTSAGIRQEFKKLNAGCDSFTRKYSNNPNSQKALCYTTVSNEANSEKALKLMFEKLAALKAPSEEDLEIIKDGILKSLKDDYEYSGYVNDTVGTCVLEKDFEYLSNYEEILNNITVQDINDYIEKYINLDKVSVTVMHPATTEENIIENYKEASKISFRGSSRKPVNIENVSYLTLPNNFYTTFYETSNDNVIFGYEINSKLPENTNVAAEYILNEILSSGTALKSEDEFGLMAEKNNIAVIGRVTDGTIKVLSHCAFDKFKTTADMSKELLYNPRINQEEFDKALERIRDDIECSSDNSASVYLDFESKRCKNFISKERVLEALDTVTLDDVKNLYNHIISNGYGKITLTAPKGNEEFKQQALDEFSSLDGVKPFKLRYVDIHKANTQTEVLTMPKDVSQADIMQVNRFKYDDSPEEFVKASIITTLLNSSSIGLFTNLREKEQLAYSVRAKHTWNENSGSISCKILTTTDNKDSGETSYDNLVKSINGFSRQINALINSEYTDEDLESAKRTLKADLLIREGQYEKYSTIHNSIDSKEGVEYNNIAYELIDKITRDDIQAYAKHMFADKPVYSIVASQDTLEANKDFLEGLKQI